MTEFFLINTNDDDKNENNIYVCKGTYEKVFFIKQIFQKNRFIANIIIQYLIDQSRITYLFQKNIFFNAFLHRLSSYNRQFIYLQNLSDI